MAKAALAKAGVTYANEAAPAGSVAQVRIGDTAHRRASTGAALPKAEFKAAQRRPGQAQAGAALAGAGYPAKADPAPVNKPLVVAILTAAGDLRDHGLRPDRGDAGGDVPDPDPLHLDVACPTTSATAGSAASCPPPPSPWSRPRATSTSASGTR